MLHDFQIGELLTLAEPVVPFPPGKVMQVMGFKGDTLMRVQPLGGMPMFVHYQAVSRTELPSGNRKPPFRRRPRPRLRTA